MLERVVKEFYDDYYQRVFGCEATGLLAWSKKRTHQALEVGLQKERFESVLEVGAGQGEHLSYVRHDFDHYVMNDLEKPSNTSLFDDLRITFVQGDINTLTFKEAAFDRIVMTCVLHHLTDPLETLTKATAWLKPGGLFSLFLPSDPGVFVRLNRRLIVEPRSRALGFNHYKVYAALDHRNHYWGLVPLLKATFKDYKISRKYYPLQIPSGNLSLFSIWQLRKPRYQEVS
jgi:phosphatidylethanolamine/phosphatidyl-N-methylethanolamine N-methyltransferase